MNKRHFGLIIEEIGRVLNLISKEETDRFADRILSAGQLFIAGAGRSGLMMRAFAMRLMHLGLNACVVGETTARNIAIGDLLIIGSGTGATGSLVHMAGKVKEIGAGLAVITVCPGSAIGKLADALVCIPALNPWIVQVDAEGKAASFISRQPMASLFEQCLLIYLDAMILRLMEFKGIDVREMYARHANLE